MTENTQEVIVQEKTMEELVEHYAQAIQMKEDLEAAISVVKDEILLRLDAEGVKGKIVNEYSVTKVTKTLFKTTLEEATELGAIKFSVDTVKLKKMYEAGAPVPNVVETSYLLIKPVSKEV